MSQPLRIALVGIGKIARDQHLPTIAANRDVILAATISRSGNGVQGVANYSSVEAALSDDPSVDAYVLCTPPQGRHALARTVLEAKRAVFLEKPPAATLTEIIDLQALAARQGVTLYASWHSRCAAAVDSARLWLQDKTIRSAAIAWKEDVRRWHPGQDWIFAPGGMGVFDPGINALSIATHILPPFTLHGADLHVPANRQTPIAAGLVFTLANGAPLTADFDFLHAGPQRWDIVVDTDHGRLLLSQGAAQMEVDGVPVDIAPASEYAGLYRRFVDLVRDGSSDVDLTPFLHVADAFMLGSRRSVAAFDW